MAAQECANQCGWTAYSTFAHCCNKCPNHAWDCAKKNTRVVSAPAAAVAAPAAPAPAPAKRAAIDPADGWDPIKQRPRKKPATDTSAVGSVPAASGAAPDAKAKAKALKAPPASRALNLASLPFSQVGLGKNAEMIAAFEELAKIYQKINDQMRRNSYTKIASAIRSQSKAITSGKEAKKLSGIGKAGGEKIDEYLLTGKINKLIEMRETHKDLIQLTAVHGVGPKMAERLIVDGIVSVALLKEAVLVKKIAISGWGSASTICLKYVEDLQKRIPRAEIDEMKTILERLAHQVDPKLTVTICGSYRRGAASSGDVDVLLVHPDGKNLIHALVDAMKADGILTDVLSLAAKGTKHGKMMGVCRLGDGLFRRVDMQSTDPKENGCALLYFTGSGAFSRAIREEAKAQGFTLNEHSLKEIGGAKKVIPALTEEDLFEALGLDYVAPIHREYGK